MSNKTVTLLLASRDHQSCLFLNSACSRFPFTLTTAPYTALGAGHWPRSAVALSTVASTQATCAFYEKVPGMERQELADGRVALRFGEQKVNLHEVGHEFEPKARKTTAGSADLCFIVDDVAGAQEHVLACGIEVIEGPIERTGANGSILSVYLRDPDGNLVEISQYL